VPSVPSEVKFFVEVIMEKRDLSEILRHHPFVSDLSDHHLHILISCVSNVRFIEGSYIFHEGEEAEKFYLLREGKVALERAAIFFMRVKRQKSFIFYAKARLHWRFTVVRRVQSGCRL